MKAKASIEQKFIKLSYELVEAMARTALASRELRILLWFVVRTYGVRVKNAGVWREIDAVEVSHNLIAEDTGIHRSRVKESIDHLLELHIIRAKANGNIGINSKLGEWKMAAAGRDFDPARRAGAGALGRSGLGQSDPGQLGPILGRSVPGGVGHSGAEKSSNAYRERAGARARGEMSPLATGEGRDRTASPSLPNGAPDTLRNRAELGHELYAPDEHPDYARADFKARAQHQADWETAQRQRENDARAAAAKAETNRIQADIAKREAEDAALSPEQKKANAQALEQMKRELREKRYGRP